MNEIIQEDVEQIIEGVGNDFSKLEGKTLLISGGGGFLGGYFLDTIALLNETKSKKPTKAICIDNFISGIPKRIVHLQDDKNFTFITQDICKPLAISEPVHFIVHAASIASPIFYREHPIETMDANVGGLRNLLELAREKKAESFLFFSTSEIYGDPTQGNIPTPETYRGNVSCTGPRACYDESKRFGETLCVNFHKVHNVPAKSVRPFNVFGPGLRLDDKRVIPDFMTNVLSNSPIVLLSDGTASRSFCYISDAMVGFWKVLLSNHDGEAFNIGNDEIEISMLDLARLAAEVGGGTSEVKFKQSEDKDYTVDNPQRRCPDLAKARKLLNYSPKISLKHGLERIYNWYKQEYTK